MGPTTQACDATIAICTYNRLRTLPQTLASLARLRGPYSYEVIVVNGPSTDGTTEFLAGRDDLRVFANPERNLAISRNIAIANAQGRHIAFIDDDAIPEADWLTLILDRFAAAPDLAAIGGFIRDANGIDFQAQYAFCDDLGRGYHSASSAFGDVVALQAAPVYPSLTGTNVIFDVARLRELNGFDEVFAYYLDETDVNKRQLDAGQVIDVLPDAEIHHKYAPSHLRTDSKISRNMQPIARSIAYFALRHGVASQGWEAVIERIKAFYRDEFSWKLEQCAEGQISQVDFDLLMRQTRYGIREGIDAYFDAPADDAAAVTTRVSRHAGPESAPIVHRMRAPEDVLRLCMFSQDHGHPSFGGIGRWSNLVARGLVELGHDVTLIGDLHEHRGPEYCDVTPGGYWSHNLSNFAAGQVVEADCLGLPASLANAAKRKLAELKRVQPRRDFQVVSAPIWDVEGAAVIGAGALPNVLSLHTCAGMMLSSKPEWLENRAYFENHVLPVMGAERQALQRTDFILANSHAILKDMSELYQLDLAQRPHAVVPHGIADIEGPEELFEARRVQRKNTRGVLRLLFLGRIEKRKGIAHFVPVVRKLLAEGANIAVDIIGSEVDAQHRDMVMGLCAAYPGQVIWHGYLEDGAIDALMRQADIFFAPSTYESFGLIYAEAMRYSMPCVAFDAGGVGEVVSDGEDGFLAPLGDDAALYHALHQLIGDPALLARMSVAARRNFEDRFGYALMAERLADVYTGVARTAGSQERQK